MHLLRCREIKQKTKIKKAQDLLLVLMPFLISLIYGPGPLQKQQRNEQKSKKKQMKPEKTAQGDWQTAAGRLCGF